MAERYVISSTDPRHRWNCLRCTTLLQSSRTIHALETCGRNTYQITHTNFRIAAISGRSLPSPNLSCTEYRVEQRSQLSVIPRDPFNLHPPSKHLLQLPLRDHLSRVNVLLSRQSCRAIMLVGVQVQRCLTQTWLQKRLLFHRARPWINR